MTASSDLSRLAGTATALLLKLDSVEISISVKALSQSVRAPPVARSSLEFNGDVLFKDANHLESGVRLVYSSGPNISADVISINDFHCNRNAMAVRGQRGHFLEELSQSLR